MSPVLVQFTTPSQDQTIPSNKVKCNDCGQLVDATFVEMSTHYEIENTNELNNSYQIVSNFPKNK